MAQTLINYRINETIKKQMELTMPASFNIFTKKWFVKKIYLNN